MLSYGVTLDVPVTAEECIVRGLPVVGMSVRERSEQFTHHDELVKAIYLDVLSMARFPDSSYQVVLVMDGDGSFGMNATESVLIKWYGRGRKTVMVVAPSDDESGHFVLVVFSTRRATEVTRGPFANVCNSIVRRLGDRECVVLCHEAREEFREAIHTINGRWSYPSAKGRYVSPRPVETHILPVFSYNGSTETRVTGTGPFTLAGEPPFAEYLDAVSWWQSIGRSCAARVGVLCLECRRSMEVLFPEVSMSAQEQYDMSEQMMLLA